MFYFGGAGNTQAVLVHQLSKGASQNPFRKNRGRVTSVLFHPAKPFLFVATQNSVRVYDLARQVLATRLLGGSGVIQSMAIHPSGDHLIVGSAVCIPPPPPSPPGHVDEGNAWHDGHASVAAEPLQESMSHNSQCTSQGCSAIQHTKLVSPTCITALQAPHQYLRMHMQSGQALWAWPLLAVRSMRIALYCRMFLAQDSHP